MQKITIDDVYAAAKRIKPLATRTPLLHQPWPDHGEFWIKPESLQPVGAFKIRGAANAIAALSAAERARGVVTYSSGNHANAVAYVAKAFGIPAAIVMQDSTPRVKVDATAAHGAEIIEVPMPEREAVAQELAERRGLVLIPPFDHLDVMAGQGTIGVEIAADLPDVDVVLVPIAGGGLASGVGVAIKALCPDARVVGVEPELAGDAAESLRAGSLVRWPAEQRARTIADGLRTEPSELTFAHLVDVIDDVVTVSEDEIRAAMRMLATRARLVAEPSGAVSTAAFLYHRDELAPGRTAAVLTGGNVDPALLADVLTG